MNKLMGSGQAARLLGVDQSTLWRWQKAGKIRAYPFVMPGQSGQAFGYDPSEVERVRKLLLAKKKIKRASQVG